MPRLEIGREPLPHLQSRRHGRIRRIDADQPHAAQYERKYRRLELDASGIAEARDQAVRVHRAREPGKLLSADRIERCCPKALLERLRCGFDLRPRDYFARADLLEKRS